MDRPIRNRLIKTSKTRVKTANRPTLILNSFITRSGMYYSYEAYRLGRVVMFTIYSRTEYDSFSLYSGEDFERSFELFCELAIALKGINYAEDFARTKAEIVKNVNNLIEPGQDMSLKKKPLFLGDSDLAIC